MGILVPTPGILLKIFIMAIELIKAVNIYNLFISLLFNLNPK